MGVRRAKARFPAGESPTRQLLQPEAIGAVLDETIPVAARRMGRPSLILERRSSSAAVANV
jgi:hypothetical protein